ncbi:MAG: hypothetical protein GVY13_14215 [Alphaproteobacteria bacterium]|jgi:pilus assembly protein CpaE|nr:hypothetical protein [Alphaproteobacteria bacterium]
MNSLTKMSSAKAAGRGPSEPILAFACDEDTLDAIARVVPGGRRGVEVREGGTNAAISAVQQGAQPELLIVDISDSTKAVADVSTLSSFCGPDTTLLAIGVENDVGVYRSLIGAGATDYLVKPVTSQDLRRTILAATRVDAQEEQRQAGRLSALIGVRGGVGASSLAVSTAWILAHEYRKQVALVDLDLYFGTIPLALDIEPGNGLRSALENADRIDSLFVASALVNVSDTLFVLGGEEPLDENFEVRPEALDLLMAELRRIFDVVIVDLPRHMIPASAMSLSTMNAITLVSDLSLSGLRDATRIKTSLSKIAPDAEVMVAASRVGLEKGYELPVADFKRGLDATIDFMLPEDTKAAKVTLAGKPLASGLKNAKASNALRDLARRTAAIEAQARNRWAWLPLRKS